MHIQGLLISRRIIIQIKKQKWDQDMQHKNISYVYYFELS